jgi:hypothetical protein
VFEPDDPFRTGIASARNPASVIIGAWTTDFRGPHPSLPYPIILFNAASASTECSATTIGPQPDECRWLFGQFADGYAAYEQ